MLTILNTSIITSYGEYKYEPRDLEQVRMMVGHVAPPFQSAIGHQATADVLTELLEVPVPLNRINYEQQIGDRAVVFKLRGRPPEGAILSREQIDAIGYDFGLLTRTA